MAELLLSGSEALVVVEGLDHAVAGVDGFFKGGYRKGTGVGVKRCIASSPSSRRSVLVVISTADPSNKRGERKKVSRREIRE